jgi:RNA polymerase sigma-70 factor (ECF subfamily)
MNDEWVTRKSLILRAKDSSDDEAWDDFVAFYNNFIYHILHCLNVSAADVDDLAQEILVKLWKNLETYDPKKGRFRTWLTCVVRNTAYNYFNAVRIQRKLLGPESAFAVGLRSMPATDLEKLIEREWANYITSYALDRLNRVFSGKAIQVFSLSLDGRSTEEIAEELNLTRDSVYTLKTRVKARYIKEVRALIREFEGADTE